MPRLLVQEINLHFLALSEEKEGGGGGGEIQGGRLGKKGTGGRVKEPVQEIKMTVEKNEGKMEQGERNSFKCWGNRGEPSRGDWETIGHRSKKESIKGYGEGGGDRTRKEVGRRGLIHEERSTSATAWPAISKGKGGKVKGEDRRKG